MTTPTDRRQEQRRIVHVPSAKKVRASERSAPSGKEAPPRSGWSADAHPPLYISLGAMRALRATIA